MLEECGRREVPVSRELRLQREGLEKDFSPGRARSLGARAAKRRESNSFILYSQTPNLEQGLVKGLGSP